MYQMEVRVEQVRLAVDRPNQVLVPDFLEEGLWCHHRQGYRRTGYGKYC